MIRIKGDSKIRFKVIHFLTTNCNLTLYADYHIHPLYPTPGDPSDRYKDAVLEWEITCYKKKYETLLALEFSDHG